MPPSPADIADVRTRYLQLFNTNRCNPAITIQQMVQDIAELAYTEGHNANDQFSDRLKAEGNKKRTPVHTS